MRDQTKKIVIGCLLAGFLDQIVTKNAWKVCINRKDEVDEL
jgi:hypothetical protein